MKLRRIFLVPTLAVMGLVIVPTGSASAVDIPAEALDFALSINPLSAADFVEPTCDKTPTEIGQAVMTGASSVTMNCTIVDPDQPITGTATNARLAASDPGFNNGTIDASCKSEQKLAMELGITLSGTTPNVSMSKFTGTVLQACTFTLAFKDAQSSSLQGTIEVNGLINADTANFMTTKKLDLSFTAKVFITAGSGAFAGYIGDGTFSQSASIDMSSKVSTGGGGGSGGSSGSLDLSSLQPFCTAAGIACTAESLRAYCANPPAEAASTCANINQVLGSAGVRAARVAPTAVRKSATASQMKLTLKEGAGQVRITAPTPLIGKTKATVKSNTKITLVATPNAKCRVTTNTGKLVGSGTAKAAKKGVVTIRPAANAYKGATSVRATCTLNKKSFKSTALKISVK